MTDAQVGLIIATPIIILCNRTQSNGVVLQRAGAMTAVIFSVAIAAVLFQNQ